MAATGPAARSAHAFLQLLLGPANAAFSGLLLLRILDPTDELVARERRDVVPSSERGGIRDQYVWFKVTVPQAIEVKPYASCCDVEFDYMNASRTRASPTSAGARSGA